MYENIPQELKKLNQWVCWKAEERNGKITKTPINPMTGGYAQSNNPSTWTDFYTAVRISENFSGIGFMLGNGIFGIDLDDMDDEIEKFENGDENNVISEFIHSLGSYAEYSPSGKGIHILCKGKLPPGGRRKGQFEFYENGRFFTMTGNIASEYIEIVDCTETVKYLHSKYIGIQNQSLNTKRETRPLDLDESQIIDIALKSKQGQAFSTLYNGFWEGLYPSQSEADLAFANMLAFWTSRDFNKMDSIFRKSGLYRPKWDSKRGQTTYGEGILNKAIADCREVFTPGNGIDDYGIIILDNKVKKFPFDDTGNADRFVNKFEDTVRYSYVDKGWYFYNGKKWEFDLVGHVKKLTEEVIQDMKLELAYCKDEDEEKQFFKHLKYTRNNRGKTNMLKESEHRLPILPGEFDKRKDIFNCMNGVVSLKNGKLYAHNHKQYLSKMSYVEYTDNIDCPMWIEFLNQIFDNDTELIHYIQKAVGYSMSGSTKEQCVFFCYGNGRNGKSTFLDIIAAIMGDYATNIQPETVMIQNRQSGANSDIARLKGARFVTTVEPNEGARINEGLLKQLTGGDTVTARHLYGREFEFEPEFKLWMSTNHKPIIRGRDLGIWRRMHLIPFTVQIPDDKVDKNLKYKLKKELTGILNWAVEGALKWHREGLKMPNAVQEAVKEYKSEMDVISAFLEQCTVRGIGEVKASELYKAYTNWADENNEYKMSNTRFGKEITLKFEKVRNRDGIYYQGLKLDGDSKSYQISYGY
ncbi:phage/plasmid primase, P4 family [Anaerosalibacter massiliensis]|uniref:Phage/plasmid primase, P4 family n=1 Tax=Anaerosalibacter massiliensis TaxID=1347392 RepID=A0A9X2S866_9FIRM|nr:phage/plasmid primase, P4 family [Anaerosalibacter massiliensis]MCR2045512.1 phage/plasmid primase, P4 family [Anaerosalibacter massiliensis]